uniref:Uncharacterized protein n=1 Tax=Panagrellus redivivus TaxID=6233 RepID=A0A7E4W7J2_PANRE
MFGILCLIASFVLAENAIIDYKTGLIALNDPDEIPSNLKGVIEILPTNSTVLIPQEYGVSLYIGHERSSDDRARSLHFTFWADMDEDCADYGIRLYRYSHNQIQMQFTDFKYGRDEKFQWDDMRSIQKNLSALFFTIEDRTMYLDDHSVNPMYRRKIDIESKQCASNQGKFVICKLHFQRIGACPLRLKLNSQHKVVLFMPSVPEGDTYFKKVFTRDPGIEHTTTTAKLESSSSMYYEDDLTETESTSKPSKRREIPLSTEWLATLLVLECFILTFSGAGVVFVYYKKCRKAKKHEDEHHSEDEELENVLENLALRPPPPNQSIQRRVTSPRTQIVSQLIFNPEANESTKTAIPTSAKNASKPKPKVIAITRPTSPLKTAVFTSARKNTVKPRSSKKSKSKNALKKAKDKAKPKSKSASARRKLSKKAADDVPNDISIRREYMKKRKLALDEKQQTTTQKTFVNDDGVKVYGVDAEGCEQTQHSEDDSYRAQIQDALLARREGS